jgi:hypothetical protein
MVLTVLVMRSGRPVQDLGQAAPTDGQDLNSNDVPIRIVVGDDAWLDLFGCLNRRGRDIEIGGIRRGVEFEFHGLVRSASRRA